MPPLILLLLLLPGALSAADRDCGRLLVSGYRSTVHVYDGCSGRPLGELAPRAELTGAQALRLHDGLIYAIAENRGEVRRYRADTLAFVDVFVTLPASEGITGLDFGPDGTLYVGAYGTHSVQRFDGRTGAPLGLAFAAGAGGLAGPDNGLAFGPDGKLYVPGYDSDSVVRWDPASDRVEQFVAPRSGRLRSARGLLFEAGGSVLVSSERSDALLRFAADGSFEREFARLPAGFNPTGVGHGADGSLLVTGSGDRVLRLDPVSGAVLGELVGSDNGGLSGATYLLYLPPRPEPPEPPLSQPRGAAAIRQAVGTVASSSAATAASAAVGPPSQAAAAANTGPDARSRP